MLLFFFDLVVDIEEKGQVNEPTTTGRKTRGGVEDDGKGVDKTDPAGCCSIS